MKSLKKFPLIYFYLKAVDFRKSINGLTGVVENELEIDLFGNTLFIFYCKNRKAIKILYWDKTGFALWYKKLEKNCFPIPPKDIERDAITMSSQELEWVLSGVDFWKIKPHKNLKFERTS